MSLTKEEELEELHNKIIDNTIKNCSDFYNVRILEAIKIRWQKIYKEKLKNIEHNLKQKNEESNKNQTNITANNSNDDDDDDEFEDAEVEEKKMVSFPEQIDDGDDNTEELNELDNISISDLSDVDPPTDNIIVGICDKITKPSARRNTSSNWKIKLKGGLMKVDGKEMFFRSLQGDLEF
ncbi:transcription initiation factor IIA subunit 1, putative [Hepatocystis sp. ex Piliocolobus tephrosceles]|nr:transcription initiation factor IIA subunit 1, putative [Hepatocystis sp. ex Piliocolobus tephrosceles]